MCHLKLLCCFVCVEEQMPSCSPPCRSRHAGVLLTKSQHDDTMRERFCVSKVQALLYDRLAKQIQRMVHLHESADLIGGFKALRVQALKRSNSTCLMNSWNQQKGEERGRGAAPRRERQESSALHYSTEWAVGRLSMANGTRQRQVDRRQKHSKAVELHATPKDGRRVRSACTPDLTSEPRRIEDMSRYFPYTSAAHARCSQVNLEGRVRRRDRYLGPHISFDGRLACETSRSAGGPKHVLVDQTILCTGCIAAPGAVWFFVRWCSVWLSLGCLCPVID